MRAAAERRIPGGDADGCGVPMVAATIPSMEPARTPPRRQDDEAFWEVFTRDVEALRSDPEAWAAYRADVAAWDRAATNGPDRE